MLNRAALTVRPAKPYVDWAASLDDSGLAPTPDDETSVYLLPSYEHDSEKDAVLKRVYEEVFEHELAAWHTDEREWPQDRSLAMFKRWFDIELHSVVEDLCADPLVNDED